MRVRREAQEEEDHRSFLHWCMTLMTRANQEQSVGSGTVSGLQGGAGMQGECPCVCDLAALPP